MSHAAPPPPPPPPSPEVSRKLDNPKQFLTASLLSAGLGYLGIDRFYLGHTVLGVVKLLTCGGLGVWWLIDVVLILTGSTKDASGAKLVGREEKLIPAVAGSVGIMVALVGLSALLGSIEEPATTDTSASTASEPTAEPTKKATTPAPTPKPTTAKPTPKPTTAEPTPTPKADSRPATQVEFLKIFNVASYKYTEAQTDLQRSVIVKQRNADMCSRVGSSFAKWLGTVHSVGANGEGKAYLDVDIGSDVLLTTYNNAFSDAGSNTLIPPGSAMFDRLVAMTPGTKVLISGNFVPAEGACLHTSNMTEMFSATSPEFIVRYSDVVER